MKNVYMCYIRVTEGKIENLKEEGKMLISTLIFICTPESVQNFIIENQVVAEKTLMKNIQMCYTGVTEGQIEKEGKMSFRIFIFIYPIHLAYLKVYTKFENTGSNRNREICDRNFHWRERKMSK